MADQAHIPANIFLCGLVPNLINCGNVVGGMSRLSVAPQWIPWRQSHSLIAVCFPISTPQPWVTQCSHTFQKYLSLYHGSVRNWVWLCFQMNHGALRFGSETDNKCYQSTLWHKLVCLIVGCFTLFWWRVKHKWPTLKPLQPLPPNVTPGMDGVLTVTEAVVHAQTGTSGC